MTDIIDLAQHQQEQILAAQLSAQLRSGRQTGHSRTHCEACGDPIPERRRQSLPGVTLCPVCADWQENKIRR